MRFATLADVIDQDIAPALIEGEYDMEAIAREAYEYCVDTDEDGNQLLHTAGFELVVESHEFWDIVSRHEI